MRIILLSGGSGKRLWPLSNDVRSKQFIKFFKKEDGSYESMVERMYRSIKCVMPEVSVTVATGKTQVSNTLNQLGEEVSICVEPARRDTFPAIALAASFLKDRCGATDEETIVVCPVDPYVEEKYFECLKTIGNEVERTDSNIVLMGIEPTYPSEKYGYILTDNNGNVTEFKEKPDLEGAKRLLEAGALWNGGVFAFKLGYMLKKAHELIDFDCYDDFYARYDSAEKISFDYAVLEKEKNVRVVTYSGSWMDVGTWMTLTDVMEDHFVGNVEFDGTCVNSHVINELDIPIIAMGLSNVVVAASSDGILVADKNQSSYMKPYVEKIDIPVMYSEKSWGSYRVMDVEESSITVKVTLLPGHKMNYHSHERRDEVWTVLSGEGTATIDGVEKTVKEGDVINLKCGCKHMLEAKSLLKVIEVQMGKDIDVKDKIKY